MDAAASRWPGTKAWFAARPAWQRLALAFLAGALATLAHAPFFAAPAYVLAIVSLVWLLDAAHTKRQPLRAAFAAGFIFGFGHYLTALHWIAEPFLVDPEQWGLAWAIPAASIFAGGLALFWGAGAVLAVAFWTMDARRIPWFAAAFFLSEWLRGHLFGGLPWILPAYIWVPGEPMSQTAALFGAYGLSALTLFLCAALAGVADTHASAGHRFLPVLVAALILGAGWGWGRERITNAPVAAPGAAPVVVAVDTGWSQAEKWAERPDQEWRALARYLQESGPADENVDTILVWPEGAIPVVNFFPLENQQFLDAMGRGLGDRDLVMGVTRRERAGDNLNYYNSAVVLDGVGGALRVGQVYDKYRLVPFGEFIPLWSLVSDFNIAPLQRIGAGFTPGRRPARLIVPQAPPATVLICYEAIFPDLAPRGADRPGWLVSVSNDSWFGAGVGPEQHYASSRYRAIEEGLPLVRAASGGVSAIVDAMGRAVSERRGGGSARAQLPPALPITLYSTNGLWLTWALIAAMAAVRFARRGPIRR